MFRRLVLPALVGAAASVPIPVAILLLAAQRGDWLNHPAMLAISLYPVLTGLGAALISQQLHRSRHAREAWRIERAALEERRRRLAAESAELQSLELGMIAELEETRAELQSVQAINASLSAALGDALTGIEGRLRGLAETRDDPDLKRIARQVEELLELVGDVDHFAVSEDGGGHAFPLPETVKETLVEARDRVGGALTWTLDPDAPSWVPGRPDRLVTVLKAAVRAATRDTEGPVHLQIQLVDRGGARGLRLRWSELGEPGIELPTTAAERLPSELGARLGQTWTNTPVLTRGRELIWWMADHTATPTVQPPLAASHVLIAASDVPTRARLRRLLSRWGLEVSLARSRSEVIARIQTTRVDVVLIDLQGESLATLEALRANPRGRTLPILLLGPVAENLVWLPAKDAPDALVQPVRHDGLLAGVEAALGRRSENGELKREEVRRMLVLEPNPALAARLVAMGEDVGWFVHAVSCAASFNQAAREHWDLVLVEHGCTRVKELADATRRLGHRVPRVGLTHDDAPHDLLGWVDQSVRFPSDVDGLIEMLTEIGVVSDGDQLGDLPSAVPEDEPIQAQVVPLVLAEEDPGDRKVS